MVGQMIPRTLLVSFPRSGTHLTIDILQAYYGSHALKWVDAHQDPVKPHHNLIKTHDFDLDVTKETYGCEHVIVLWRDKKECLDSLERSGMKLPVACSPGEFWDRWVEKWPQNGHGLMINYSLGIQVFVMDVMEAANIMVGPLSVRETDRFFNIAHAIDRRTQ